MIYYKNKSLLIRSMEKEDARIFNETYLSYGWHPSLEIYENYYKEQEENKRKVFIAEFEGEIDAAKELSEMQKNSILYTMAARRMTTLVTEMKTVISMGNG